MIKRNNIFKTLFLVLLSLFLFTRCNKDSDQKEILSFKFDEIGVVGTINQGTRTILAVVPYGNDVTSLVPTIEISDKATVFPASGVPNNFTNPVVYTVTAEDGSKATYTVTVTISTINGDPDVISGNIDTSTTWPDLGLSVDYIINGMLTITSNALLTIEPGVTIMFSGVDGGIEVGENAGLRMVGTANKPIILTGPSNNQNNGSWDRVLIHSNRNDNQFEHVRFLRGGSASDKWNGVVNVRGKLSMKHCIIDGSLNSGLSTEYDGFISEFEDNTINHCKLYPWITENFATLCSNLSYDNTFVGNEDNCVYVGVSSFELTDDMTLAALPIPYYFQDGFSFYGNKTLTIAEGTNIKMAYGTDISVGDQCCFIAKGTAQKPIVFRSDNAGTAWSGIIFSSTRSRNLLEYCQIMGCGDSNLWDDMCCLYIRSDAKLTLNNNSFGPSNYYGVGIENIENWGNVQHSGNTFTGCALGNVYVEGGGIYNGQQYDDFSTIPNLP